MIVAIIQMSMITIIQMMDHDNDGDSDNEPDMFVCDNGNEIPMDWVNDGMDDCGDNSDEYDDSMNIMMTTVMKTTGMKNLEIYSLL